MKSELKNHIKTASKSAYYVTSRIAGYCTVGWTLNLIAFFYFILMILPEVVGAGARTGVGAIIGFLSIFLTPKGLLVLALFGIGFPAAYFIFGKKQGVSKALNYAINKDKVFIFKQLLTKFADKADPQKLANSSDSFSKLVQTGLEKYINKADNIPRSMRFITRHLIKKTGVQKIIDVTTEINTELNDSTDIINNASQLLSEKVQLSVFKPNKLVFPALLIANIVTIIGIKVLLF